MQDCRISSYELCYGCGELLSCLFGGRSGHTRRVVGEVMAKFRRRIDRKFYG